MTRIGARVADEFESGTDCTVMGLKLKNRGTGETCETGELDLDGNSWYRGGTEYYNFESYPHCDKFQPREKLQFKFHFHWTCIDHMQLVRLRVYFWRRYYQWNGKHWFTPSSGWMDFDFEDTEPDDH